MKLTEERPKYKRKLAQLFLIHYHKSLVRSVGIFFVFWPLGFLGVLTADDILEILVLWTTFGAQVGQLISGSSQANCVHLMQAITHTRTKMARKRSKTTNSQSGIIPIKSVERLMININFSVCVLQFFQLTITEFCLLIQR